MRCCTSPWAAKNARFYGWTLAAFWLASAHMGDADGLLYDLSQTHKGAYVDDDWVQIYETSLPPALEKSQGFLDNPWCYCVTSHGLLLQAMNDALVSDYFGKTVIGGACPTGWQEVAFANFHTQDGAVLSGEKSGGKWRVRKRR